LENETVSLATSKPADIGREGYFVAVLEKHLLLR
jgi:hypothetical protein